MAEDPAARMEVRRRRRRWPWVLVVVAGVLIILGIVAQPLMGSYLRGKLISTVEKRSTAGLQVGTVTYLPPYGMRVRDASITVEGDDGEPLELVKVRELDVKLAKLPIGSGPLVIKKLSITDPQVHLIKTEAGLEGIHGLIRPKQKKREEKRKLSEMFLLRHFSITGGSIIYEDRTQAGSVPVVWKNLDISTETQPKAQGVYSYDFSGSNGSLASMKSAGTFDIDNLVLDAQSLAIQAQVRPDTAESTVPAAVQRILNRYAVQGNLRIDGKGHVPMKDLPQSSYQVDLALDNGRGEVPGYSRPINRLMARMRVSGGGGATFSTLMALEAVSGPDVLHIDDGDLAVDLHEKRWQLRKLDLRLDAHAVGVRSFRKPTSAAATQPAKKIEAGGRFEVTAAGLGPIEKKPVLEFLRDIKFEIVATANDFQIQPPGLAAPIQLITGAPIMANQDVIRVSNLTGRYGFDQYLITTLRIPLRDLPRIVRVEEFSGSATFDRHTPPYPGKIGHLLEQVRPEGPFEAGGMLTYNREARPKFDYHLLLHSDQGALEVTKTRVPITRIHTDILADPGHVELRYLEANIFGGLLSATGSIDTGENLHWQGKGSIKDFDLRDSVQALTGKEFDTQKLAGRVFLDAQLQGGRTRQSVSGSGDAQLYQGRLFEVPVLSDILGAANMGKGLVGSEAAATFALANDKVIIHQAAAGSAAVGVQGSGTVGFDKSLDLNVIVAPLGQWKERLQQTGVPIVSAVLGDLAGALQKVVNTAASNLLYQFHVGGTSTHPQIVPVPVPLLTEGAANVFGAILARTESGGQGPSLIEQVKKQSAQKEAPAHP